MWKKISPFLIILITVLFLYHPVLFTYFSQDDFFHFKVSQTDGSLTEFIKLFGFYPFEKRGIAFYRPLSREIPFNLYYSIFGLNHFPFRIFTMIIHFVNIYLVFLLVQKLFKNKFLSFFTSFFFGITAANVATLYYLAGGIQTLLATAFVLLSLLFFYHYIETSSVKFKIISLLFFLLGISSHEQTLITPFLIFGLGIILKLNKRKVAVDTLPFFCFAGLLVLIEVFKMGFSSQEKQYQAIFSIKTAINSLFWYSNWALGIPETLIDFVSPGLRLNPTLLRYWSNYYILIFPAFFISTVLLFIATSYLFIKMRGVFIERRFLFNLIWFPLGLLPVILLPLHKSTHYLPISLPAFWVLIGYIIFSFYKELRKKRIILAKIFMSLVIISLTVLSSTSAILGSTNYWAANRGKLAEKLLNQVKKTYPNLPKGTALYLKNDPNYPYLTKEWGKASKQAAYILNGSDALQLLYNDPTIKVFYEDLGELPKDLSEKKVYSIIVKIYD